MDIITMKKMLTATGISENDWIVNKDIYLINLASDGNHYNSYYDQMLHFDTNNGILRIKYYNYILVSSKFYSAKQLEPTKFEVKPNFSYYGVNMHTNLPKMRNPKIGDHVYTINSNGVYVASAKITSIISSIITVDAPLTLENNILCYASGKLLKKGVSMFLPINSTNGSMVESLDTGAVILYRSPKTIYNADDYIFFDNINGFSMNRY